MLIGILIDKLTDADWRWLMLTDIVSDMLIDADWC